MGSRSPLFKTLVVFILLAIFLLQVLSMVQSDRLYARLNEIERTVKDGGFQRTAQNTTENQEFDEGDWLIYNLPSEPANLNPIISKDIVARVVLTRVNGKGNIFESLIVRNLDTLEYEPYLAESYSISEDGLEFTFNLKRNIYFSDGKQLTADDVVFTFDTVLTPGVDAQDLVNYLEDLDRYEKIDDVTVKFIMKRPYFRTLETLGEMPIIPKHIYKFDDPSEFNKMRSDPIGSGPYIFEKWNVGSQIVLRRNKKYWDSSYTPNIDKVVFKIITNDLAALQALKSRQLDVLGVTPEQYVELVDDKSFTDKFMPFKFWNPSSGYTFVAWNNDHPIFSDTKVRLAMTHLIDRELLNKHFWKGLWQITTGPFYPESPQYDTSVEPWLYNPKVARELLTQAGWLDTNSDGILDKDGRDFRFKYMYVGGSSTIEAMVKLLKDEFSKVGIVMEPDPYEWSIFSERLNNKDFEVTSLGWGGSIESDPYQIWHSSQMKNRGSNFISYSDPEVDELIVKARQILDPDSRNSMYHELHRILHEQQPYTFMFIRPSLGFLDKRFKNVKIHKLGLDWHEWYVPKDEQRYK